jgi:hypothetical protein
LDDLIFLFKAFLKASNSYFYCEFLKRPWANKAIGQNQLFEGSWVYTQVTYNFLSDIFKIRTYENTKSRIMLDFYGGDYFFISHVNIFKDLLMLPPNNNEPTKKIPVGGIFFLVLTQIFILCALYLFPFLILGLHYDVPEMLYSILTYIQENWGYGDFASRLIVWLALILPALIAGYISYFLTNKAPTKNLE